MKLIDNKKEYTPEELEGIAASLLYDDLFKKEVEQFEIPKALINFSGHGSKGESMLHRLVGRGDGLNPEQLDTLIRHINFFIENGAKIDAQDNNGSTPLMYAASPQWLGVEGRIKLMKPFLDKGADLELVNKDGLSALGESLSRFGFGSKSDSIREQSALCLIKHGAKITAEIEAVFAEDPVFEKIKGVAPQERSGPGFS
jgi:Ankyrin repeat